MLVVGGLSACTGSGQVTYSGEVQPPQLIEVRPGVQVVADYDQPVFYSDSYYWRYDNGVWYRSREHTRGWARVEVVPPRIRTIDRPQIYVHYRGNAQATTQHDNRVEVRDQRDETPAPPPEIAPPTTTNVDVRENHEVIEHREVNESRRDAHKDAEERRKDAKEQRKDAKEQRKDAKEQRKEDKERRKEEKPD